MAPGARLRQARLDSLLYPPGLRPQVFYRRHARFALGIDYQCLPDAEVPDVKHSLETKCTPDEGQDDWAILWVSNGAGDRADLPSVARHGVPRSGKFVDRLLEEQLDESARKPAEAHQLCDRLLAAVTFLVQMDGCT